MNEFFCTPNMFECIDGQIVGPSIIFFMLSVVVAFFVTTFFMVIFEPNTRVGPDTTFTVALSAGITLIFAVVFYGLLLWAITSWQSLVMAAASSVLFVLMMYIAIRIRNYRYGKRC